jgi:hypothetical protein
MNRPTLTFYRLTNNDIDHEFTYTTTQLTDNDLEVQRIIPKSLGFNLHVEIQNYTAEDVILAGSLKTNPTIIHPSTQENTRVGDFDANFVIVKITYIDNSYGRKSKKGSSCGQITIIKVSNKKLNSGAVFIEELDSYLCTLSHHAVAGRFIFEDSLQNKWDKLDIALDASNRDPSKIYDGFRELAKICVTRQDQIHVRTGSTEAGDNFRIAILDSYFIPSKTGKLIFDPELNSDTFIVEFARQSGTPLFVGSYKELNSIGVIYIDQNEVNTISGKFCGMVLLRDEEHLSNYFHKRKSIDRFREEGTYLMEHSGDITLRQELDSLRAAIVEKDNQRESIEEDLKATKKHITEAGAAKRYLETQIKELKDGWASQMSSTNITTSLQVDLEKLAQERRELEIREAALASSHKAAMAKNRAETVKNILTVISITFTAVTAAIAGWKKIQAMTA